MLEYMLNEILITILNNCCLSNHNKTLGNKAELPLKRVKLIFKDSPIGQQSKQMHMVISDSSKRVLFEESSQPLRPSQRPVKLVSHGPKDMTQFEWSFRIRSKLQD
jgi:hypothetical protein